MKRTLLLVLFIFALASADPFNTIAAYTVDQGSGWLGPYMYATVPIGDTTSDVILDPYMYFGYGVLPRFDVTVFANGAFSAGRFSLGELVVEPRYMFIAKDNFLLSGVLEASIPLSEDGSFALTPGIMATLFPLGKFNLHADLFYYRPLTDETNGEIWFWVAPDLWVADNFSIFGELNTYYSLDDNSLTAELWPGACWYPVEWLSVVAACGVPATLDYVSPGLAAYVSF
ncbi:hypothetical protein GX441_09705 [bacterium]|nr:hypothetical protein [bacterium]